MTLRCTMAHATMLAAQIPKAMPIVFFMMTFLSVLSLLTIDPELHQEFVEIHEQS